MGLLALGGGGLFSTTPEVEEELDLLIRDVLSHVIGA